MTGTRVELDAHDPLLLQDPDAALTVSLIIVTAAPKANMPPLAATLAFIVIEV